jgi:5'-methylthioadenosine phosphorylase
MRRRPVAGRATADGADARHHGAVRIGLISGAAGEDWPGLEQAGRRRSRTPAGDVPVTAGRIGDAEVVHVPRHGAGHARLAHLVQHRANLRALIDAGADVVVSVTTCGAVDPTLRLGTLVVFDDFYFPSNRLPDGSLCTWHTGPGPDAREPWIFSRPFDEQLRKALVDGASAAGYPVRSTGCYGQVDGPRWSSRAEVAALARLGVTAVGQTAAAEAVLAGEAGLPIATLGYLTDYANGVGEPEPGQLLAGRMRAAADAFVAVVQRAAPAIARLPTQGV